MHPWCIAAVCGSALGYSSALAYGGSALASPASAGDLDEPPAHAGASRRLRWQDVVALVERHPRLAAARAARAAGAAELRLARQLPPLSAGVHLGRGRGVGDGRERLEWGAELALPLERWWTRPAQIDGAASQLAAREGEAAAELLAVLEQAGRVFYSLAYEQLLEQALVDLEHELAEVARLVRRRVERGDGRPIEAARIETELERLRIELDEARAARRAHQIELSLWIGASPAASPIVETDLDALPPLPDAGYVTARVAREHPAGRAARHLAAARAAEVTLEARQSLPSLELGAFVERELDREAVGGRLTLGVPFAIPGGGGAVERAEALAAEARARAEAVTSELLAEALATLHTCAKGQRAVQRYRDVIVPRAEAAAAMLARTFEAGEIGLLDVLDARRVLGDARRDALGAQLRARLDCFRLQLLLEEGGTR